MLESQKKIKKNMGSKNDFDRDLLRKWFGYNYVCWFCGKNHWDCFHHILGRTSNSILNAAPLNNSECHIDIHSQLRSRKNTTILLDKTIKYLLSNGYVLDENDKKFIEKNKRYYVSILKL